MPRNSILFDPMRLRIKRVRAQSMFLPRRRFDAFPIPRVRRDSAIRTERSHDIQEGRRVEESRLVIKPPTLPKDFKGY